jgi:AcrR family transcriptional regulator
MKRRAEQVDETRQRITEAAVKLHTTIGPAHTSISKVAEEADVTRLTVYRHFSDLDALFVACMGHWGSTHPIPDVARWSAIESPEARARGAFEDLYAWFAQQDADLHPIYRDWSAMPGSARQAASAQFDSLADAILFGHDPARAEGDAGRVRVAVARHLVDYRTWRSLVVTRGLRHDEAVELAVAILGVIHRDQGSDPS